SDPSRPLLECPEIFANRDTNPAITHIDEFELMDELFVQEGVVFYVQVEHVDRKVVVLELLPKVVHLRVDFLAQYRPRLSDQLGDDAAEPPPFQALNKRIAKLRRDRPSD